MRMDRQTVIPEYPGLCRPTRGFRDLDPPYMNNPGYRRSRNSKVRLFAGYRYEVGAEDALLSCAMQSRYVG